MQASHSALEAGRSFPNPSDAPSHLILIEVSSEEALLEAAADLTALEIRHHLFFEPDDDRGYTSLTTEALFTKERRRYFLKKKLYRFRPHRAYSTKEEKPTSQEVGSLLLVHTPTAAQLQPLNT